MGRLGECSVIPGQVRDFSSCLSHAAEFCHLFYFVITWEVILDGHDVSGFHRF